MRALVVGLGSIGRRHLENLRRLAPEAEIVALRRTGAEVSDPSVTVVTTLDAALALSPELAILASPAPFHVSEAMALAQAGAHLFVEKPISDRVEGVAELLAETRRRKRVLMVGYPLRFAPSLKALKVALDEGRIGRVMGCRAEVGQYLPDWRPGQDYRATVSARPELGGGATLELSHEFDYLQWLFGEVRGVSGWMGLRGAWDLAVEDWVEALLQFEGGVVASVHLDMASRPPFRSCRIQGTEGTLAWDGLAHEVRGFRAAEGEWTVLHADVTYDRNTMYREALAHFLHCVATGESPSVDGEAGLRALEVALAVKGAAQNGRREVLSHA